MKALLVGRRTCDLQIAGSTPGWAPLHNGLEQATYTRVPLSPSSIIWYRPRRVISLPGKVTAGLVESNTTGFMTNVSCGLLPRNQIVSMPSARNSVWDYSLLDYRDSAMHIR